MSGVKGDTGEPGVPGVRGIRGLVGKMYLCYTQLIYQNLYITMMLKRPCVNVYLSEAVYV